MRKVLLFPVIALAFFVCSCGMADMTNPTANEFNVIIVGDSIYDLDGFIHNSLQALTGYSYKDYSRSGDSTSYIRDQYEEAIDDNPNVRTIIMDSGGNDILMDVYWSQACQSSTMTVSSSCRSYINGVLDDVEDLWTDMNDDGIDAIVHTGYYYLKRGVATVLLYGGTRLNGAVKYADEQLAICAGISPANLYFIDPRSSFSGHESSYIKSDGIHPTSSGGSVMANLINGIMVANNIFRGGN
jgi:hypothetical protein